MTTRRPTTIPAMLLHLARLHPTHARTALAVVAVGSLGVGLALRRPAPPAPAAARPMVTVFPASPAAARSVLGVGVCSTRPMVCVSDATCGAGGRCVDPHDLRGLVLRHRTPGTLEDEIPIFPSMTWSGEGYGLAWSGLSDESADVWFARASAAGQRLGAPLRVTRSSSVKLFPTVAASPAGYAITWTDIGDDGDISIWMQRLDRGGVAQGQPARIPQATGLALLPRVVWNGSEYAVLWYHLASQSDVSVRFARFTPDGARVGADSTVVPQVMPTGVPGFAWMGDAYGAAWSSMPARGNESTTNFARIGAGGEGGTPLRVSSVRGQNGAVSLTWAKGHFGAVWEDNITLDDEEAPLGRLAFAGVTPTSIAVPRRELTPRDALYTQPTLAWTGAQYGLTWARVGGDGADVYFRRLDAEGKNVGDALKFTSGAMGIFPTLAWSGTEFAVAWTNLGARGFQLRFARIDANGRRVGNEAVIAGE